MLAFVEAWPEEFQCATEKILDKYKLKEFKEQFLSYGNTSVKYIKVDISERMTISERKSLSGDPITWKGDLDDDCIAEWAGLMLRAEWMDDEWWWWAVYDMQKNAITIDESNEYDEQFIGGAAARKKAEDIARQYAGRGFQLP